VFTELRKMLTEIKFIKIVTSFVVQKRMTSLVLTAYKYLTNRKKNVMTFIVYWRKHSKKSSNVLALAHAYKYSWFTDKNHKIVTHWTSNRLSADAENEWR
jgi:hypothetical protein